MRTMPARDAAYWISSHSTQSLPRCRSGLLVPGRVRRARARPFDFGQEFHEAETRVLVDGDRASRWGNRPRERRVSKMVRSTSGASGPRL